MPATTTLGSAVLQETDIASASTCDIGALSTLHANITGTTGITSLGTGAWKLRFVRFAGILTLTHNATSLILPGGANITTGAGDTCVARSDASGNWRVYCYQRASTAAALADLMVTGQIAFPATQNASAGANTLDDYEEGNWTPTIGADSVDGSHTYSNQLGSYIKIGRLVHIECHLTMTAKDAALAGNVQIAGLPFTHGNPRLSVSGISVGFFTGLNSNVVFLSGYINHNVTRINLAKLAAAGTVITQVVAADITATSGFYLGGTYYANG